MSVSPFTLSFPSTSFVEANRYGSELATASREPARIAEVFSPHK